MATAYRSSTSTNTGAAAAGSLALTVPSGIQIHDSLIAAIAVDGGNSPVITPPAGWTLIRNSANGTVGLRVAVYWRLADGTEPASYTWTFDTSWFASGTMLAYSGANTFAPPSSASTNTTTASTTLAAAATNSSYETGLVVQIFSARNTTAVSSITPGGSYTNRENSCTTATTFVNVEAQDVAKGLTMSGSTPSNAACSQTATALSMTIFLEDLRPAFNVLGEDEFLVGTLGSAGTNLVTATTFQTTGYNELILACCAINKDAATVTSMSGGGLTWVLVTRANTNLGSMELWRAFSPTPLGLSALTINFSASVASANFMFASILGADFTGSNGSGAIGATNTGSTTLAAASINLTTTRNNSWVWAMASQVNTPASFTAGSNQTILRTQSDGTNLCGSWMWRQNNITPTSGTVVTMNCTAPANGNCNIVAVEILPAVVKNLGGLGVG